MRAIVQRVSQASVSVNGQVVGRCGVGLLLLVGVHRDDTEANARRLADRIAKLRIFNDEGGKMNLALRDPGSPHPAPSLEGRGMLAISNFTVYGETAKNRRPSFVESAGFERGKELFDRFVEELRALDLTLETGVFGAHMEVSLINDGPVTVIVEG